MSKAILLLDEMPEYCDSCPCCDRKHDVCTVTGEDIDLIETDDYDYYEKPDWCPLRELPEKKYTWDMEVTHFESLDLGEHIGWNDCIDYISGEKEIEYE